MTFIKNLIQLTLRPARGWEDIAEADEPVGEAARRGLYPLTALTALSVFMTKVWHPAVDLAALIPEAVATFVMYFAGYFTGALVLSLTLERYVYAPSGQGAVNMWRCHTFSLYATALLEVITLVQNCAPITLSITLFLPLGVALVMWMGRDFLYVGEGRGGAFMAIAALGVLVPPYLIRALLLALI